MLSQPAAALLRRAALSVHIVLLVVLAACGGGHGNGGSTAGGSGTARVALVLLENETYSDVLGSPAMPYLNSLAQASAVATNYYANTHPSIGNYFTLTTGQTISNDDSFSGTVMADNVVRRLLAAGKSWKSYQENLPAPGYVDGDTYPYVKHHDPFGFFSDVLNSSAQLANIVPFAQFAADLAANALPNYSFIVPNQQNNSHDCPAGMSTCTLADRLGAADRWLQANVAPLLANPAFQSNGVLIIVFDESITSDVQNGGGHIFMMVGGPRARAGFRSSTFFQHQSTLNLTLRVLGLPALVPAADMSEMLH